MSHGKDAKITVLTRFVHPSIHMRNKYPNTHRDERLNGCVTICQAEKVVRRKNQLCIVFRHDDFPGIELYAVKKHCVVTEVGPTDLWFDNAPTAVVERARAAEHPSSIVEHFPSARQIDSDDIANFRANGIAVDVDTEPAPENRPNHQVPGDVQFGPWGSANTCPRRMEGVPNVRARLKNCPRISVMMSPLQLFDLFFPMSYVKTVLIPETNKQLNNELTLGEFYRWLGIWLLLSTTEGSPRSAFWSQNPPSCFSGAPFRLHEYMSKRRFEDILSALTLTDKAPPSFVDRFHKVRQFVDAWNENMAEEFSSSWKNCLDESMMIWTNEWTGPGFMVVPRKPKPMGNEWHTICCCDSGILFHVELMEGKDHPSEIPVEFEKTDGIVMKTVGLLKRMTRSLWGTGKVVIMDSGFCVLRGLIELKKHGVYGSAVIKKRRYWPKHIRGDDIAKHFEDAPVGAADMWPGTMLGERFGVYCMKEEDYVMSLMSTYGTLERGRATRRKLNDGSTANFSYVETHQNHFDNRHQVDDFNNRRHNPISVEETWRTQCWEHRVFAHLFACSEQNAHLAYEYFGQNPKKTVLEFRKELAKAMIYNDFDDKNGGATTRNLARAVSSAHALCKVPLYQKWDGEKFVDIGTKYPQWRCKGSSDCNARVRTYCSCSPGRILCQGCFAVHVAESTAAGEG